MQYLYSALILHKVEQEINEKSVTKVLKAAGAEIDTSRVKALVAALSDIDIEEALANAVMTQAVAGPPATGEVVSSKDEKPTEEEDDKEEEEGEEIDDDDGLGSLFG